MTSIKKLGVLILVWGLATSVQANDREDFDRAVALGKQGQWQQAASLFEQLAARNPQWPEPKNNLAVCLLNLGQVEQAQKNLDAAVTSKPSFSIAQNNRQRLYDYLAAQAYSKALSQKATASLPSLELIGKLDLPAMPPAPVPTPAPTPTTGTPASAPAPVGAATLISVEAFVNNWAQAWSRGDVKNYLAAYSQQFRPDDGKKFDQWADSRRTRLQASSLTRVDVQDLQVYINAGQAASGQQLIVEFEQSYTSATYHDRTLKQLLLAMEGNSWRILAERVLAQLPD